jgi:hypothetical protein
MTYIVPSPSLMELVGHSGMQAPQAMQSSVIFMDIAISPQSSLRWRNPNSAFFTNGLKCMQAGETVK